MRVFVTGATGFIGALVVQELIGAGHEVVGLCRDEEKAPALAVAGAEVCRGTTQDFDLLRAMAARADGVIHLAFDHDFSKYLEAGEADLRIVAAMAEALAGSGKPLVVTSGMTAEAPGRFATEADPARTEGQAAVRGRPEQLALAAAETGVRAMIVRLPPSVHDRERQGLTSLLIEVARRTGVSAYVGDGSHRWPAVHRRDAARLFRLALEQGQAGRRFHAVAEEGLTLRAIAEAIGAGLGLPVRALDAGAGADHFGWLAAMVANDVPASSRATRESLGWRADRPGLLQGLRGDYLG